MLRQLQLADMDAAARVHRSAFDHALPALAGLHTPEQDRWFFRERVFKAREVWGAFDEDAMTGMLAFRQDWIEQLYVLPEAQGRGLGTALCRSRKTSSTACNSGPSNATCRLGVSTKREALR
jgi:GNAT superfamily N-acetyltransferase